jgi:hypothetical protein
VEKTLFNEQAFRELEQLKPLYFNAADKQQKDQYKLQIDAIIHTLTNGKAEFDFEIYFSEVFHQKGGFDVLVANPPYVRQEKIKELKPNLKAAGYECFSGTADLLVYFYERAVKLLRSGGSVAFITSNKYYRAGYGKALRGFLPRNLTLHQLIDFGDASVFEAIAYASILIGIRTTPSQDAAVLGYTWENDMSFGRIAQIISERGQTILQSELKPDGWQLESPATFQLLKKLRESGKPLGEYVGRRLYRGVLTGFNEAFIIDRTTRDCLIQEHESSAEIIKPFLRGRDVKRWRLEFADQYLIKIESSENKKHSWSDKNQDEAEKIFEKTYPAVHSWFKQFRFDLKKRADQGKYFWELRSCKYWDDFQSMTIAWGNLATQPQFTFAEDYYISAPASFIVSDSKFLLGLLNSNITRYLVSQNAATRQGGFWEFKPMYISPLAIPAASPEQQQTIELLVDQILAAKAENPKADTNALEREIDQLVYALYELTPDEIVIVEGAGK